MDDAVIVSFFQGLGDLLRDGEGFIDGDRSLCDAVGVSTFSVPPTGR